MTVIDSHLHFDVFEQEGLVPDLVRRAREAGVAGMVAIGGTEPANRLAADLADRYPGLIRAAAGYDRDEAGKEYDPAPLKDLLAEPRVAAVGETGLDYHYSPETAEEQKHLFRAMLDLAAAFRKPVVVHSRDAEQDTLELLEAFARNWEGPFTGKGVLHCFTGGPDFARAVADMGFMVSFSGILTFKNAGSIREAARAVPEDRILIETDAPYLAPVPHRGRRNEPAYVVHVAETLAEVRGCAVEHAAAFTSRNARTLFGFEPSASD